MARVLEFSAHGGSQVHCAAIGANSFQVMATGGADRRVNVWRLRGDAASPVWSLGANSSAVRCVAFDAHEQCLITGADGGSIKVRVYDTRAASTGWGGERGVTSRGMR